MKSDSDWMTRALELARMGESAGEVPVGAVIVDGTGELLAEAFNQPISGHDPTAHAEMLAIRAAGLKLENYRLDGATLYCTLEPCPMCAGAIVNARVKRLVFGARDLRFGGVRSKFEIADSDVLNHKVEIEEGLLGPDCTELLVKFFKMKR